MTAREFWKKKFGEEPQTDADKLAIIMMQEYANEIRRKDVAEATELIKRLGPATKDNQHLIKADENGKWWIEHREVGSGESGEPLERWLTRESFKYDNL